MKGSKLAGIMAIFAIGALLLSGCGNNAKSGGPQAQQNSGSQEVVVYGWSGQWDLWFAEWGKEFEKETGIKLKYVSGGTSEIYQKALTEASSGKPTADLFMGGAGYLHQLNSKGLLESIPWDQIPNGADVDQRFKNKNIAFWGYDVYQIGYNTDFLKGNDVPKKWIDLANPKLQDKVVMRTPGSELTSYIYFALERQEGPDKAMEDLLKIFKNSKVWAATPGDLERTLSSGEAWVGEAAMGQVMLSNKSSGKIAAALPEDGAVLMLNGLGILKGAPHKEAAAKFVNFFLSTNVQNFIMNDKGVNLAVNSKVTLTNDKIQSVGLGGHSVDEVLKVAFIPDWEKWTAPQGDKTKFDLLLADFDKRVKGLKQQ